MEQQRLRLHCTQWCRFAITDTYANSDSYRIANPHTNTYSDCYSSCESDANTDTYSDSNSHRSSFADTDADANRDTGRSSGNRESVSRFHVYFSDSYLHLEWRQPALCT
jgi:hypothetical protein